MIEKKNFAVKMNYDVKYKVLCSMFNSGCKEDEFYAYFKKNFLKIFKFAIDNNDMETVNNVAKEGKLITKLNIDKLIDYASEKDRHEAYVVLLNYKNDTFSFESVDDIIDKMFKF